MEEQQQHDEPMLKTCDSEATSSYQLGEKGIRAIVSIRLLSVRTFDGNGASFSVATGFVVDMERGLILTNRHVVTPWPVVADAISTHCINSTLCRPVRCLSV
ncbi:hypothetical protein PPTG_23652 [Phytophthora nicotianae INRA-310]|uniref:Uncharacterized protein n=1 Tax=Phytophthora nicotianae (strain INRA-310) TaxID=761204 RepID=W2PUD7_PHYN3|nr:hypothetical protein PPTG_23652 [Phytophthora nicotianae INRA-310]ETN04231.1 hypothetical protein PPTG_23652 [Phytophthora nicotianae INRA-310]